MHAKKRSLSTYGTKGRSGRELLSLPWELASLFQERCRSSCLNVPSRPFSTECCLPALGESLHDEDRFSGEGKDHASLLGCHTEDLRAKR